MPNHTEHIDCGYSAGVAGSECNHDHGEGCGNVETTACIHDHGQDGCTFVAGTPAQVCTHVCSADVCGFVAPTAAVPCQCPADETGAVNHGDGCTYVPASDGSPCTFQHGVSQGCTCVPAVPDSGVCTHVCSVESGCVKTGPYYAR